MNRPRAGKFRSCGKGDFCFFCEVMIELNQKIERSGENVDAENDLYSSRGFGLVCETLEPKTVRDFSEKDERAFDELSAKFKEETGALESRDDFVLEFYGWLSRRLALVTRRLHCLSEWYFEVRAGDVSVNRIEDFKKGVKYLMPEWVDNAHFYTLKGFEYRESLGWVGLFHEDGIESVRVELFESVWRMMRKADDCERLKRREEEADYFVKVLKDSGTYVGELDQFNPREYGWIGGAFNPVMEVLVSDVHQVQNALRYFRESGRCRRVWAPVYKEMVDLLGS